MPHAPTEPPAQASRYEFGSFRLDLRTQTLRQGEREIRLAPKTYLLLKELVEHAPALLTKEQLFERVWAESIVVDAALSVAIAELRKALGDRARDPIYVETAHRRGYRFIAPVHASAGEVRRSDLAPTGREKEMQALMGDLARARSGSRRMNFLVGEAGIGKTMLVQAFVEQLQREGGVAVAEGQCIEQQGPAEPYLPVLEALGRLARRSEGENVREVLAATAPSWLEQMPMLRGSDALVAGVADGPSQLRMLREISEALEILARDQVLLVILEDLHWADAATLDLLSWIARRKEPAKLIVLGTYRPGDVTARDSSVDALANELALRDLGQMHTLSLLSGEQIEAYLRDRFACEGNRETARFLHRRTEGNPLFMAAMVDHLLAQGLLDERATLSEEASAAQLVPEGMLRYIRGLIAKTTEEERVALEAASVVGLRFDAEIVAGALGREPDDVERSFDRLSESNLFVRDTGTVGLDADRLTNSYAFQHALYQQALSTSLPSGQRARLHRGVGMRLEARYGALAGARAAELARHFDEGRDAERAIAYLTAAGVNAVQRGEARAAVAYLGRARHWVGTLPETAERAQQEMTVLAGLLPALVVDRGYASPELGETLARCHHLADEAAGSPQAVLLAMAFWLHTLISGDYETSYTLAQRVGAVAETLDADWLRLSSCLAVGISAHHLGRLDEAGVSLARGDSLYRPEMHEPLVRLMGSDPGPVQLAYLAWNDQCGGNAESAGERIVRAQQMAKARGHDPTLVVVQLVAFWILYAQQRFDRLREEIDLLIDRAREGQYAMWRAVGTLGDGTERACNGGVGIERIREGLAAYRATGAQFASEHIGTWEVDALLTAGEPEAALARASELLESECGSRPQVFRPELRRQRAEALIALSAQAAGDERMRLAEQARDQLERAVDDARGLGVRWVRLRAATRLARLELEDGRPERASALVEEALDGIVGPADLADIAAAQRLRREIGRPT